jgi:bifunctional non-homologous end joining protein LigD
MPLEEYRRKRDFTKTPEPAGPPPTGPASEDAPLRFVVGRHRATRLHYDFRLEVAGVLVSWSVPKGPTLDPAIRRMAVRVEDHPIDYLDFEGVIPRGEYGAGDAIVWDRGTYEPKLTDDPASALERGELKFRLAGEKLRGRFTIVRTNGDQWLLIKKRDAEAVVGWDPEDHPRSVATGRTNEEVASAADRGPSSGAVAKRSATGQRHGDTSPGAPPAPGRTVGRLDAVTGAVVAPMPSFVEPMAATLGRLPFSHPDWLFEVKWDGYRVEAHVRAGHVRASTRSGRDAAEYFPGLLEPPTWIAADEAIVDGEVVALRADGTPDFGLLQERIGHAGRWSRRTAGGGDHPIVPTRQTAAAAPAAASTTAAAPAGTEPAATAPDGTEAADGTEPAARASALVYEVFDLLYLDGRSLLDVPLQVRKELLRAVLREHPAVRYAGHVERDGEAFFAAAAQRGLEGVMAKHRRSRYAPGRRPSTWLKLKARPEQEFVVAGFSLGVGSHAELGSLILAVMGTGGLRYAGRVGSGIDARTRRLLRSSLDALGRVEPAVMDAPPAEIRDPAVRWVDPRLVVRARFAGWTRDGVIRQSSFAGLAADRDARSVVRERAVAGRAGAPPVIAAADLVPERTTPAVEAGAALVAPVIGPGAALATPVLATPVLAGPALATPALSSLATATPTLAAMSAPELAGLDLIERAGVWRIGGLGVHLTNLDRVLFRADGLTKRDLVRYLAEIGPVLLPHLAGRPLNLTRYPEGIEAPSFWQRELPASAPAWLHRWREPDPPDRRAHTYLVADSLAALAWLGNVAAVELHPWTSRLEEPARPSFALIDIDPGERTTFDDVVALAKLYRTALEHLGVRGYPKVTGKRGLQIFVPVRPVYDFDQTRDWVERLSRAVGAAVPGLVSWEWSVDRRSGLARLDYTQNARNKTLVAPYSVRPLPGAPVSAPISWDELDDPRLRPNSWTIRTILGRVRERGDLFAGVLTDEQELPRL